VARATAGKIVLNRQLVDLRELTQRAIDGVKLAMGAQRHQIIFETPAGPATVFADPVRIEQVVANLLTNSVKYTPPGGTIRIQVAREDDHVLIRVSDSGEGIPPSMLPRIFEPFVQLDQNIDRSRGGLGLGLPLVNLLVKMHGGKVEGFSEGPGRGSEFVVSLPLATGRAPVGRAPVEARAPNAVSRRVLIVEDSADARAAMRSLVRMWGHDVVVAEDGPSGMERAREFRPEIALLDIGLPGLDGYQVARHVREALGQEVCLIALTGYGQAEDKERARQAGFDCHLVKPVEPAKLKRFLADPALCRASGTEGGEVHRPSE
jgi:CheY-like chemotaxis protein/two-component sensor histidine kinase